MNVYAALLLNFLPLLACFVLFLIIFKTKISMQLTACFLGLIAVLPITFLQFYALTFFPEELFANDIRLRNTFFKMLFFNGLIEEGIKAIVLFFIPHKKTSLRNFFLLALLSGLCLGCFESMIYFLQHLGRVKQQGNEAELLYGLIFIRMFSSDLIHTFCAGLCGLFVWSVFSKKITFTPLIFAIFIHGIFNFFVYFNNWIHWFALPAVLFAIIECRVRYEKLTETKNKETNFSTNDKNGKNT